MAARRASLIPDRQFIVRLLGDLVRIDSVNPRMGGAGEVEISNFIAKVLDTIPRVEVHTQKVEDDRFNVIGILRGEGMGPSLMLNGHTDTVSTTGMTIDPLKPLIKKGYLHGRGACDMKGALAAMIGAVQMLSSGRVRLRGDVMLCAVVDEEYGSAGTETLVREYRSSGAIVGEPTNLNVAIAHKGFVWLEVETHGKAAHGSVPEKGVDAIANMGMVITALQKFPKKYSWKAHPLVGPPKIHTSMIEGGMHWSIIPDFCKLRVERRMVPGESAENAVKEIEALFKDFKAVDRKFSATVRKVFDRRPMEIAPDERIVRKLRESFRVIRLREPDIVGEPFWTDAAILVEKAKIPACLFGPGDVAVAHSADEYVKIEDVIDAAMVYAETARRFCGVSEESVRN